MTIEELLALIAEEKREEARKAIEDAGKLTDEIVEKYLSDNQPLRDRITGKAIKTHQEKEEEERKVWEKKREKEIRETGRPQQG